MDSILDQGTGSAAGADPLGNSGTFGSSYSSNDADQVQGRPSGAIDTVKQAVTSRVQAGTDWLKDRDVEQVKETIETQVREHPVRTLLVALGAGYLLGKALRR